MHACWRDDECQSYGAPKRLYVNSYLGSLWFEKWSAHFHRADRRREGEWYERGVREGRIKVLPDGTTIVRIEREARPTRS